MKVVISPLVLSVCHWQKGGRRKTGKKKKELKKKRKPQILKVIITNLPLSEVAVWLSVVTAVL